MHPVQEAPPASSDQYPTLTQLGKRYKVKVEVFQFDDSAASGMPGTRGWSVIGTLADVSLSDGLLKKVAETGSSRGRGWALLCRSGGFDVLIPPHLRVSAARFQRKVAGLTLRYV